MDTLRAGVAKKIKVSASAIRFNMGRRSGLRDVVLVRSDRTLLAGFDTDIVDAAGNTVVKVRYDGMSVWLETELAVNVNKTFR